jgi:hypothetical protein
MFVKVFMEPVAVPKPRKIANFERKLLDELDVRSAISLMPFNLSSR